MNRWTVEQVAFVRMLRKKGRKYDEISRQWKYKFGTPMSAHAIRNAMYRITL